MPKTRKMPAGKMQFGIIVPVGVHRKAKILSGELDCRISDVYTKGIEETWANLKGTAREKTPKENLSSEIMERLPEEAFPYMKAMATFLKSNPAPNELQMISLMLHKYLPQNLVQVEDNNHVVKHA